jgi:hypothetical protein
MWIEDKDGNAYNLDYAFAVKLRHQGQQDKTWDVCALMTRNETNIRDFQRETTNVIVLLSTDNEQKARDFFANVKAHLGIGSD